MEQDGYKELESTGLPDSAKVQSEDTGTGERGNSSFEHLGHSIGVGLLFKCVRGEGNESGKGFNRKRMWLM